MAVVIKKKGLIKVRCFIHHRAQFVGSQATHHLEWRNVPGDKNCLCHRVSMSGEVTHDGLIIDEVDKLVSEGVWLEYEDWVKL